MDVTSKNIYSQIEPNISDEIKNNLKPDPSLLKKFINKEDINIKTKNLIYNTGSGDCWFKTISLALYNSDED